MDKALLVASGTRILGGREGVVYEEIGKIHISKAAHIGIDQNLFGVLKGMVDALALSINVNSIDTGTHVPTSRHYDGRAVDINLIGPHGHEWTQATLYNVTAVRLVNWLLVNGFHVGEGGPWSAILFGPIGSKWNPSHLDHSTHLHVSVPRAAGAADNQA